VLEFQKNALSRTTKGTAAARRKGEEGRGKGGGCRRAIQVDEERPLIPEIGMKRWLEERYLHELSVTRLSIWPVYAIGVFDL
jgi:hypothetical protein